MQNQKNKGQLQSPSVHVWADVSPLPAFKIETGAEARARVGAVHVSDEWLDCVRVSVALASRAMPAGPLLLECQGQQVLAMAQRQAGKLQASTAKDGRAMSDTSVSEAVGAGAAAVVAWRNGQELDGGQYGAAGVCWRAVVASVSRDMLGESIEEWRGEEGGAECWDSLTGSMLPLPQLVGDGSRQDRASRLLFERARAKRGDLLARRVETLKLRGGRGKRGELIDKLHRAAVQLLHGVSVDKAAQAAGFKSSRASGAGGVVRAGDRLMEGARRLGLRVQFNLRQSGPSFHRPIV